MGRQGFWRAENFKLQRWIVGAGFGERSLSFRFWRFGRRDQAENARAFSECIRSRERFLFQRNVLIALGADEGCVSAAIRLPEHIAAHRASATYGNPDCGSFVGSHWRLAGCECGGIIHWNAFAPEWKATLVMSCSLCSALRLSSSKRIGVRLFTSTASAMNSQRGGVSAGAAAGGDGEWMER